MGAANMNNLDSEKLINIVDEWFKTIAEKLVNIDQIKHVFNREDKDGNIRPHLIKLKIDNISYYINLIDDAMFTIRSDEPNNLYEHCISERQKNNYKYYEQFHNIFHQAILSRKSKLKEIQEMVNTNNNQSVENQNISIEDAAKLCEIAYITGRLTERNIIETPDHGLEDMFNSVYLPLYNDWKNNTNTLNDEEQCYISAYAQRILPITWAK
jgi:DNA-binding transcriptional MerR regulator